MKFTPMAVCCTCTSSGAGAGTATSSRRMTSGPPTSWMRMARGKWISREDGLLRVPALAVLGEIETLGLLFFTHAQPDHGIDDLQQHPGDRRAPGAAGQHAQGLNTQLRGDVLLHEKARAAQRDRGEHAREQGTDDA